jgi:hypothetical protein
MEEQHRGNSKIEENKLMKYNKYKGLRENLATTIASRNISMLRIDVKEFIKKLRQMVNKLKDILISAAKIAMEKIKKGKGST